MAVRDYPILVTSHEDEDWSGFVAFAPDLPGCVAFGDTRDEAFVDVQAALLEWIDEAKRLGRDIPVPNSIADQVTQDREEISSLIEAHDKLIKAQDEIIKAQDGKLVNARAEIAEIRRLMVTHTRKVSEAGVPLVWAARLLNTHAVKAVALNKRSSAAH